MCVTVSEPRFHQATGPSPEVSPRNLVVLYVPETIPERQSPCEHRNAPSSSPTSLAKSMAVQAETIQGNVGFSSKMPLRGDDSASKLMTFEDARTLQRGEFRKLGTQTSD